MSNWREQNERDIGPQQIEGQNFEKSKKNQDNVEKQNSFFGESYVLSFLRSTRITIENVFFDSKTFALFLTMLTLVAALYSIVAEPRRVRLKVNVDPSVIGSSEKLIEDVYYEDLIPVGLYTYRDLSQKKSVSYIRQRNNIIGAIYDPENTETVACFSATISRNTIDIIWKKNLELIGLSEDVANISYSVSQFTADNSIPREGLDNPLGISWCLNQFR